MLQQKPKYNTHSSRAQIQANFDIKEENYKKNCGGKIGVEENVAVWIELYFKI